MLSIFANDLLPRKSQSTKQNKSKQTEKKKKSEASEKSSVILWVIRSTYQKKKKDNFPIQQLTN